MNGKEVFESGGDCGKLHPHDNDNGNRIQMHNAFTPKHNGTLEGT